MLHIVLTTSVALTLLGGVTRAYADHMAGQMKFRVRIENVSKPGAIHTSTGADADVVLAPGAWIVHTHPAPVFADGQPDRGQGLENAAEDGNPRRLVEDLSMSQSRSKDKQPGEKSGSEAKAADNDKKMDAKAAAKTATSDSITAGVFSEHAGGAGAGSLRPAQAYEFVIMAQPGGRLSFVSMFAQSNDCFYAPGPAGIPLFDGDKPLAGDVTSQVRLWDAGTEINQEPGAGPDQGARQSGANTGASENGKVQTVNDGFKYPAVADSIRVTITPLMEN